MMNDNMNENKQDLDRDLNSQETEQAEQNDQADQQDSNAKENSGSQSQWNSNEQSQWEPNGDPNAQYQSGQWGQQGQYGQGQYNQNQYGQGQYNSQQNQYGQYGQYSQYGQNQYGQNQYNQYNNQYQNYYGAPLASMGMRLGAYIIDQVILGAIAGVVSVLFMVMFGLGSGVLFGLSEASYGVGMGGWFASFMWTIITISMLPFLFQFGYAYMLYKTNGQTPGKRLLGLRVVRKDGMALTLGDGVIREMLLKGLANSFTSGILNLVSFILGCSTPDCQTIHDMASKTTVLDERPKTI